MTKQKEVNVKIVSAYTFREAFLILKKVFDSGSVVSDLRAIGLAIPIAVNCAFTCEMFLKSFLSEANIVQLKNNNKAHKLDELFICLKETTKKDIVERVIIKMGKGYDESQFYNDLTKNSNAFVEWRYFFEKQNHFSSQFMDRFQEALFIFAGDNDVGYNEQPDY